MIVENRGADWSADLEQMKFLGHCFYVNGLERGQIEPMNAEWAIDPWPLRAKGLIVLVSPN